MAAQQRDPDTGRSRRGSIQVDSVDKIFQQARGTTEVEALRNVSFTVEPGEFVSLVGPSGCGKSTLLKAIGGLHEPTAGSLTISGTPVTGPRRAVGIMFQHPELFPWRNVLSNVLLPIDIFGWSRGDYEGRARDLLRLVGLDDHVATAFPSELSGGMQQRVALCRVLVADPEIVLRDEPFAAVDEFTRERLDTELLDVWEASRKTIVFVTHNITEAVYLADRVMVMASKPGRIVDVLTSPLDRAAHLRRHAGSRVRRHGSPHQRAADPLRSGSGEAPTAQLLQREADHEESH